MADDGLATNDAMSGELPANRLVTWAQLREQYGVPLSLDSARRLWRAGNFPEPRRIGGHRLVWNLADVEHFIRSLVPADKAPLRRRRGRKRQ
jgi:predicted DNA-binding transcriptional regulator AlpA